MITKIQSKISNKLEQVFDAKVASKASFSQYQSLLISNLLGAYGRVLKAALGKPILRTAYVGDDFFVLTHSELLWDLGMRSQSGSFFEGSKDDVFHASRSLGEIDFSEFDLVIIAATTPELEARLTRQVRDRWSSAGAPDCGIIALNGLMRGWNATMKKLDSTGFFSCLHPGKLALTYLALAMAPRDGIIVECGSYLCGTAIFMALSQSQTGRSRPIFALDTFGGMPAPTSADGETIYQEGLFHDNLVPRVQSYLHRNRVNDRVQLVKGLVQDTLPAVVNNANSVALAFLDTDQYDGTRVGFEHVLPKLSDDGVIVIDDTTLAGVDTAINEALAKNPEYRRVDCAMNFSFVVPVRSRNLFYCGVV